MARVAAADREIRAWVATASASGPSSDVGRDVVAGEGTGQLRVAEGLKVTGDGQVPGATVATGEGPVRDLADEGLDELVLPALR